MELDQRLGKMSDRELIIFLIGDVRHVSNKLDTHLVYHKEQDMRHWKVFVGLLLTTITIIGGVCIAVLT